LKAKRKNSTKKKSLISSKKVIAYLAPKFNIADWKKYDAARKKLQIKNEVLVKPREANYFKVKAGQFFRINITTGSQVGDLNLYNLRNLDEKFFSGKRQGRFMELIFLHKIDCGIVFLTFDQWQQ